MSGGWSIKVVDIREKYDHVTPRIDTRNVGYSPPRSSEKVLFHDRDAQYKKHTQRAQPMVRSLDKVHHTPGGGNVKIYQDHDSVYRKRTARAQPKVSSREGLSYIPGGGNVKPIADIREKYDVPPRIDTKNAGYTPRRGGNVKIFNDKLEWNTSSKIRSLDNVNYKPGYGYILKEKKYEKDGIDYDKGLYKRKRWWEGVQHVQYQNGKTPMLDDRTNSNQTM